MRVVLLGGVTGMLAHDIEHVLSAHNITYLSLARNDIPFHNSEALYTLLNQYQPNYIINTIAYTQVDNAEENHEEAYFINAYFPKLLALYCQRHTCKLLHYSTDFIFDGNTIIPYSEDDSPAPLNIYGKTKYQGECEIINTMEQYYIVRTAWLFGIAKENFITKILHKVKEQHTLSIVANQYGSPTSTYFLAQASLPFITDSLPYGVYHLTNQGEASWFDLASYATACYNTLYGTTYTIQPILSSAYPQKAHRPHYSVLSTQRYIEYTGIQIPHWRQAVYDFIHRYVTLIEEDKGGCSI